MRGSKTRWSFCDPDFCKGVATLAVAIALGCGGGEEGPPATPDPPVVEESGDESAPPRLLGEFAASLDGDAIANVDVERTSEEAMTFTGESESGHPFRGALGGEIEATDFLARDAPIFPGIQVLAAMEVQGKVLVRARSVGHEPAELTAYYAAQLTEQGWITEDVVTIFGPGIRGSKDQRVLEVSITEAEDGAFMTLTIDAPRDSSS